MPRVFIPAQLRELALGRESLEVSGDNVRQVISSLEQQCSGISKRLLEDGRLAPGLVVCINGQTSSLGLHAAVPPDAEVHFLPALGGGR